MHVRAGTAADLVEVARIQAACPGAAQWDMAGYPLLVAEADGRAAAFLAWRDVAPGEAEILNLAVDPAFRRRGLALALLAGLPPGTAFLEVRESNGAARELYRKGGFVDSGIRYSYYDHPPEAAIVMTLKR